jgi:branched-chain amino acid aminotransferase
MVLSGITRAKVFEICRAEGIVLKETIIRKEEMTGFQAAFNTGTSRKVLPVKEIGGFTFNAHHPLTGIIMKGFDGMVEEYLRTQTRAVH